MSAVQTALGPLDPAQLGQVLMHEHVSFEYPGWELNPLTSWDRSAAVERAAARLAETKATGLGAWVDFSAIGVGRDAELLAEVSRRSGVPVVVPTGWWIAAGIPAYFTRLDVDHLARIMVHDVATGIGKSGIKAGVIKAASSQDVIHPVEERVLQAAGRAQAETGCCVSTHTSGSTMGLEQIELLTANGADPARIIIGHSDDRTDLDYHRGLLDRGVTVQFDHIGVDPKLFPSVRERPDDAKRAGMLAALVSEGHAGQLTLSQDTVGERPGQIAGLPELPSRHPRHLFERFVPILREAGISDGNIRTLLVENPARLLAS
jgi:phosphotriesterase-related protein